MARFKLREFNQQLGRVILINPNFDFDSYPALGEELIRLLSAHVIEKQSDADLHSWLIDFEGCQLFLRGEHYSETMWLEALNSEHGQEELSYLAQLFSRGIE